SLKLQVVCLYSSKESTPNVVPKEKQESNDNENERKYAVNESSQINPSFSPFTSPVKKQSEYFDIKLMLELVKKAEEAADTIKD
ncbi:hypothetical protein RFI_37506, partial [Reticulomyxa filosa]